MRIAHAVISPRRVLAALSVLTVLTTTARAQDTLSLRVVHRLAGMDAVRVDEGIVYKRADVTDLRTVSGPVQP